MSEGRTKKRVKSMEVESTDNGGYIVHHRYDNSNAGPSYAEPAKHAFVSHAEMLTHFAKHSKSMGDGDGDEYGGAAKGAGKVAPQAKAPKASKQTGTGKKKAAPPNQRTRGAGID